MRPPRPLELVDDIVLFANGSMLTRPVTLVAQIAPASPVDSSVLSSVSLPRLDSHQVPPKSPFCLGAVVSYTTTMMTCLSAAQN
ncbi:hypothetical protein LZ30DRAFT_707101 [Colletotrichum cereale]|nr:hypothetical protein LZ30DRAFT_707101 [Colletotrichum cereale]